MFGRKNGDDYDDYNERNAAKYDDDYIAPSHDYRRECDHSHEQTYEDMDDLWECRHSHEQSYQNINEVRECNHSHEQTYADADTEQRPYDNYNTIESLFEAYLEPNEHLLWAGGPGDLSKQNHEYKKKALNPGLTILVIGIVLMFTCFVAFIGLAFIATGIILLVTNSDPGLYAVTDRRMMILSYGDLRSFGLEQIESTNVVKNDQNVGRIHVCVNEIFGYWNNNQSNINGLARRTIIALSKIQDPVRVKQIIDDACVGARCNNYQNQGKV